MSRHKIRNSPWLHQKQPKLVGQPVPIFAGTKTNALESVTWNNKCIQMNIINSPRSIFGEQKQQTLRVACFGGSNSKQGWPKKTSLEPFQKVNTKVFRRNEALKTLCCANESERKEIGHGPALSWWCLVKDLCLGLQQSPGGPNKAELLASAARVL